MVRFIEMMPIGSGRGVLGVSNAELYARLKAQYPELAGDPAVHGNGPAVYIKIPGWEAPVGFISAMHGKFCADCNRIRLTSQGKLKPCLCYGETLDLMPVLRGGSRGMERRENITKALREAVFRKPAEHCFETPDEITESGQMAAIGG